MALYQVQIVLNMTSGLPEDAATNTWYFDCDDEADLASVRIALQDFYAEFDQSLSSLIDINNCVFKAYRLSDPKPRPPISETVFQIATKSVTAAPTEQCVVLSYQGAKVAGLPQARRRGRVFLGPWGVGNYEPDGRITTAFVTTINLAGNALLTASNNAATWTWAQYSPTNQVGIDVNDGWVDNEWDTQRRRGRAATARQIFDGS